MDNVTNSPAATPEVTAIVATNGVSDLANVLEAYRPSLDALGKSYELICVTDAREANVTEALGALAGRWSNLFVLALAPWSGDDSALDTAVKRASGDLILTLPGWSEIDPEGLPKLFDAIGDADLIAATRRMGPMGSWQSFRRKMLDRAMRLFFDKSVGDPFCRVLLSRKEVLEDVTSFGVRQHFIAVIAAQRGFKIAEVELEPAKTNSDNSKYVFKPLGHLRAMFDALALFVVLKFLRRPLRFFGSIGMPIFLIGVLSTTVLAAMRIFGDTALSDRPILIFSVLMVVLGIQIIAIGLVGEIIIFSNARRMKQYVVKKVINRNSEFTMSDGA